MISAVFRWYTVCEAYKCQNISTFSYVPQLWKCWKWYSNTTAPLTAGFRWLLWPRDVCRHETGERRQVKGSPEGDCPPRQTLLSKCASDWWSTAISLLPSQKPRPLLFSFVLIRIISLTTLIPVSTLYQGGFFLLGLCCRTSKSACLWREILYNFKPPHIILRKWPDTLD